MLWISLFSMIGLILIWHWVAVWKQSGHGSQEERGNLLSRVWRWIVPDGLTYSYYLVVFTQDECLARSHASESYSRQ